LELVEDDLHIRLDFAFTIGAVGSVAHLLDAQIDQYGQEMAGDKDLAVVDKMPNSAFCRLSRKKTNAEIHEYLPSG
jgi:hypothetical protein